MDLIIYPNPRIDQTLLLDGIREYNFKTNKPVNMRILESRINSNNFDDNEDVLHLFIEIRQAQFYCKAYHMKDGEIDKTKTVSVKASWETVQFHYPLVKQSGDNYRVECNDKLFNLLNYALQKRGKVMRGNRQGFKNVSYYEIINSLNNLNFKAVTKGTNGQQYIVPSDLEEITITND